MSPRRGGEVQCECCGCSMTDSDPEEQAAMEKEWREQFPNVPIERRAKVCGDCYDAIMAFKGRGKN